MSKLRLVSFVGIILTSLFSIAAFLIILFGEVKTNGDGLIGSLVTAISIIVALGIGYSMINVYDYSNKVDSHSKDFENLKISNEDFKKFLENSIKQDYANIDDKICELQFNILILKKNASLSNKNLAAKSLFDQCDYLQALKTEFDILVFLFDNFQYFKEEFNSHTGSKRKFIANDILKCIANVNSDYLKTTKSGEITDLAKVIFSNIKFLQSSPIMKELYPEEQIRFKRIFLITENIVSQILKSSFPIKVDDADMEKLDIYANKIIFGDGPDNKQ